MKSQREAREHIESIRRGLRDDETTISRNVAQALERALEILSNQLNEKSTHFLLELLQNADDNTYTHCSTPTINFPYKSGSLRVECNEDGFTADNVEAICDIHKSTKAGSAGYTGEKGIGFKSVFKVADAVWISSLQYTFKLDKREQLGMISPVWVEYPVPTSPEYTSFFLQLSDDYDEEELVQAIMNFDAAIMIFLRRLRVINFQITKADGTEWTRKVYRTEYYDENSQHVVVLHSGDTDLRYISTTLEVKDLPQDSQRPGTSCSQLQLAFPVTDFPKEPNYGSENVYAFLPVRNYGFKFLLQGDFILTANRESINASSPWNSALRESSVEAFIQAIDKFNSGPLRYHWPYYLPSSAIPSFFDPMRISIMANLKEAPVLESFSQDMVKPSLLWYVPPSASDEEGIPFTLNFATAGSYLSSQYPAWAIEQIYALGVKQLSSSQFLEDLKMTIEIDSKTFQERPMSWHSQLARSLVSLATDSKYRKSLEKLCLIPLQNGGWTSARNKSIHYVENYDHADFLGNLDILVIDFAAATDLDRKNLFTNLGATHLDVSAICRRIISMHAASDFAPQSLTKDQLISQVKFLYSASWQPAEKNIDLWFATSKDGRCKGSKLYMSGDFQEDTPISRVFAQLRRKFPTIHDEYMKSFVTADGNWRAWLQRTFGLSTIPRLSSTSGGSEEQGSRMSEEFEFIFKECKSSDVLHVLVDNWSEYSPYIQGFSPRKEVVVSQPKDRLKQQLREIVVECTNGMVPLRQTVLPGLDNFMEERFSIPVLQLEDPTNHLWAILGHFGVAVKTDIYYYLSCLYEFKDKEPGRQEMAHLYGRLQHHYDGNEGILLDAFDQHKLIYLQRKPQSLPFSARWFSAQECIDKQADIYAEYPACKYLFRCLLHTDYGSIDHLVTKATAIKVSHKLADISDTFKKLSNAIENISNNRATKSLKFFRTRPLFPITSKQKHQHDHLLMLDDTSWFIADRAHLKDSFEGKLPLLAFSIEDLDQMKHLISFLGLDDRRLSNLVQIVTGPKGLITDQPLYTQSLRAKSGFLKALIPKAHPNREQLVRQLEQIEVRAATEIVQSYTLVVEQREILGRYGKGQVSKSVVGNVLIIFMSEESISAECPPFELAGIIQSYCAIKVPMSLSLLHTTMSDPSITRIYNTFTKQGVYISDEILQYSRSSEKKQTRNDGRPRDVFLVPSKSSLSEYEEDFVREFRQIRSSTKGKMKRDRRLPVLNSLEEDELLQQAVSHQDKTLDPHRHLEYLGERLTSEFLAIQLGAVYDPVLHWTSPLRSRAGYSGTDAVENYMPFTLSDQAASDKMTDLLIRLGHVQVSQRKSTSAVYRFLVAVTDGDQNSPFVWSTERIELMRTFRLQEQTSSGDIMILVRITKVYTDCEFDLFVNPWELIVSHQMIYLGRNWLFEAVINEQGQSSKQIPDKAAVRRASFPSTWSSRPHIKVGPNVLSSGVGSYTNAGRLHIAGLSPYTYSSLGFRSIRLFSLLPGDAPDSLRGFLFEVPFETSIPYRAISYVWGTEYRSHSLITPDGRIRITTSLSSALQCLRQKENAINVWADGICINQADLEEKSQQIGLLPRIFQNANCTIAFLGEDEANASAIVSLMQIRAQKMYGIGNKDWPESLPSIPLSWNQRLMPQMEGDTWTSISAFFDSLWFQRVWIIQEVVAASDIQVICGKWMIRWDDLVVAALAVDREFKIANKTFPAPKQSWTPFLTMARHREWEVRCTRWCLLSLLEVFRYAQSTVRRDRFFALLGFASDGNNAWFEPDYTTPFERIVSTYASVFVRQGRGMRLLQYAGLNSDSDRFPSWIPDWTINRPNPLSHSVSRGAIYNASGRSNAKIKCLQDDILAVEGYQVDEVTHISKASNTPEEWHEFFQEVDTMIMSHWRAASSSQVEDVESLGWKVPIANVSYPEVAASEDIDLHSSYVALRMLLYPSAGPRVETNLSLKFTTATASSARSTSAHKFLPKFFRTKKLDTVTDTKQKDRNLTRRKNSTSAPNTGSSTAADLKVNVPTSTPAVSIQKEDKKMKKKEEQTESTTIHQHGDSSSPPAMKEKSLNYVSALQEKLLRWRFIATKRGDIGMAPPSVQIGDVVAIFSGGNVPFVVRRSEQRMQRGQLVRQDEDENEDETEPEPNISSKGKQKKAVRWHEDVDKEQEWWKSAGGINKAVWRLVGECYVHGIMNEEALDFEGVQRMPFFLR